jgi:hypothetical protein
MTRKIRDASAAQRIVHELVRNTTMAPEHRASTRGSLLRKLKRLCWLDLVADPGWHASPIPLFALRATIERRTKKLLKDDKDDNIDRWKSHLQSSVSACFRWLKSAGSYAVAAVLRPDGTFTSRRQECFRLISQTWDPIVHCNAGFNEEAAETWARSFPLPTTEMPVNCLQDVDQDSLVEALAATSNTTSPGLDGWRANELKALPHAVLGGLAIILGIFEENKFGRTAFATPIPLSFRNRTK